jgi:hypothetical protein
VPALGAAAARPACSIQSATSTILCCASARRVWCWSHCCEGRTALGDGAMLRDCHQLVPVVYCYHFHPVNRPMAFVNRSARFGIGGGAEKKALRPCMVQTGACRLHPPVFPLFSGSLPSALSVVTHLARLHYLNAPKPCAAAWPSPCCWQAPCCWPASRLQSVAPSVTPWARQTVPDASCPALLSSRRLPQPRLTCQVRGTARPSAMLQRAVVLNCERRRPPPLHAPEADQPFAISCLQMLPPPQP